MERPGGGRRARDVGGAVHDDDGRPDRRGRRRDGFGVREGDEGEREREAEGVADDGGGGRGRVGGRRRRTAVAARRVVRAVPARAEAKRARVGAVLGSRRERPRRVGRRRRRGGDVRRGRGGARKRLRGERASEKRTLGAIFRRERPVVFSSGINSMSACVLLSSQHATPPAVTRAFRRRARARRPPRAHRARRRPPRGRPSSRVS
eukprot:31555-Pelagococcus_subviridis.AAC.22